MNNYIKKAITKYLILLIVLIIFFSIIIIYIFKNDTFKNINNICRVLVSDELNKISKNYSSQDIKYKYIKIPIDKNKINISENQKIENFFIDSNYEKNSIYLEYTNFLIKENKITDLIVFKIPKSDVIHFTKKNKTILICLTIIIFSLILIILFKIYRFLNKEILNPVLEMHNCAKQILNANYTKKIRYDYYGEIGSFAHDFEKMRDALEDSIENEKKLKISEKELLAYISHDLKTPIANIQAYCEGILDGVVRDEKDIKRYTNIILNKSKATTKMLDDILEVSKAEINKMTIRKKELYTNQTFKLLVEEISLDVISNKRKFILEGEIPNLLLNMDIEKIKRLINNIISNSIKYTLEDGIIKIKFENIIEGIKITIKDNGVGIRSEEIKKVFNKFYRADKERNQNIQGSGLGLSIAKHIAELHNGSIKINSLFGEGTSVIIILKN